MLRQRTESKIIRQHFGQGISIELSTGWHVETGRPDAWILYKGKWQLVEVKDRSDRLRPSQRKWFYNFQSMTGMEPWILYRDRAGETILFKTIESYDHYWLPSAKRQRHQERGQARSNISRKELQRLHHIAFILTGPNSKGAYTVRCRCQNCKHEQLVTATLSNLKTRTLCQPCGITKGNQAKVNESIQRISKLPFVVDKVTRVGDGKRFEAEVRCPKCNKIRNVRQGVNAFTNYSGRCKSCALSVRGLK